MISVTATQKTTIWAKPLAVMLVVNMAASERLGANERDGEVDEQRPPS